VRDQVSHPYSTTGKITVLYILIFRFFDIRHEEQPFIEPTKCWSENPTERDHLEDLDIDRRTLKLSQRNTVGRCGMDASNQWRALVNTVMKVGKFFD
jgi:hypothetical protein